MKQSLSQEEDSTFFFRNLGGLMACHVVSFLLFSSLPFSSPPIIEFFNNIPLNVPIIEFFDNNFALPKRKKRARLLFSYPLATWSMEEEGPWA